MIRKKVDDNLDSSFKRFNVIKRYHKFLKEKAYDAIGSGVEEIFAEALEQKGITAEVKEALKQSVKNFSSKSSKLVQNLIDDAKSYFDKALPINPNLTSILSEKELTIINKVMNNNTKQ